jgi:integrase
LARPEDARATDRVLRTVPSMRAMTADLKFAGIERITTTGRLDLHGMRMTLTTYLAVNGVSQRIAQSHLRHKNPMLTATTYTDPTLLPVAGTIGAPPSLPTTCRDAPAALHIARTGT